MQPQPAQCPALTVSSQRSTLKRYLKPLVFVLCTLPLLLLSLHAFEIGGNLGANPVEKIQDTLGQWGLRLLIITLAITPLRNWFNMPWLVSLRRMLGLFAFT